MATAVNLGSTINWTAITGATSYEIMSQDLPGGTPHLPAPVDVGLVTSAMVSQFLPNGVIGNSYQLFVRAKAGTDIGPFGQLDVDLTSAFGAPTLSVA